MSNAVKSQIHISNEPCLLISRDGYHFDFYSNIWTLNKEVNISFQHDVLNIDADCLNGFRKTLSRYAQEMSAKHTSNMYFNFQRLVRATKCKQIDDAVIRNWRAMLHKEKEWYLGALRGFLISWHDYGYKGITKDTVKVLEKMRLSGNRKGVAVLNRCMYTGAFTQHEQTTIACEFSRLFTEDKISLGCYSYLFLLQASARRPEQLRELKAEDIQKAQCPKTKAIDFHLNIPRGKQRGVGFRESFSNLAITEDLYLTLINLVDQNKEKLCRLRNQQLNDYQNLLVPIFLDEEMAKDLLGKKVGDTDFEEMLNTDILHSAAKQLTSLYLNKFMRLHNGLSERTGDVIPVSARRFRYTRGTNLGRKGVGSHAIGKVLDHSDNQNAVIYTENTADTVTYIDKTVGKELALLAKAFKGEIIESIEDGEQGADPKARIPNNENEVVGACGTNEFCIKGYEACYLCNKFRPLLDAPHEKFLEGLYAEKEARLKDTKSEEYANTKDSLILAVEYVVDACTKVKAEREGIGCE